MASHYVYGRKKELQVVEFLARRGWKRWERSQGSRGPADLLMARGRRRIAVQVKATRGDYTSYTRLTVREEKALLRAAKLLKAAPVLALTSRNYVWFVTVPEDDLLLEGKLLSLRYVYPDER